MHDFFDMVECNAPSSLKIASMICQPKKPTRLQCNGIKLDNLLGAMFELSQFPFVILYARPEARLRHASKTMMNASRIIINNAIERRRNVFEHTVGKPSLSKLAVDEIQK